MFREFKKESTYILGFLVRLDELAIKNEIDPFKMVMGELRKYRSFGTTKQKHSVDFILAHRSQLMVSCAKANRKCSLFYRVLTPLGNFRLQFLGNRIAKVNGRAPIAMIPDCSRLYISELPLPSDLHQVWLLLLTYVLLYLGNDKLFGGTGFGKKFQNLDLVGEAGVDKVLRKLDCRVFKVLCKFDVKVEGSLILGQNMSYRKDKGQGEVSLFLNLPICRTLKELLLGVFTFEDITEEVVSMMQGYGVDILKMKRYAKLIQMN